MREKRKKSHLLQEKLTKYIFNSVHYLSYFIMANLYISLNKRFVNNIQNTMHKLKARP